MGRQFKVYFNLATLLAVATCRYLFTFVALYLISFFLRLIASIHPPSSPFLPAGSPPENWAAILSAGVSRQCPSCSDPGLHTIVGIPINVFDDHRPTGLD